MNQKKYLPAIDGLRAIAVVGVILFHIRHRIIPGGYLGVDVFFVISGFLITTIIVNGINDGNFSFKEFYLRRIQRLLPNVILMVVATLGIYWIALPINEINQIGRHGLWVLFSLSNIFIHCNIGSYWGESAEYAPFTHTWSLGVEEQFYWIFPMILLLFARYFSKHLRLWFIAFALSSYALYIIWSRQGHTSFAFYMLPSRMWELATGAILSMLVSPVKEDHVFKPSHIGEGTANVLGLLGIVMVVLSYFIIDEAKLSHGEIVMLPALGSAFIIVAALNESTFVSRLLSIKIFVYTGRVSYSLYLWHWPMIILGKRIFTLYGYKVVSYSFVHAHLELFGAIFGGVIGIITGLLAYYCVEKPLRNRGAGRFMRLKIIAVMMLAAVVFCAMATCRDYSSDLAGIYDRPKSSIYMYNNETVPSELGRTRYVTRYMDVDFVFDKQINGKSRTEQGGILRLYGNKTPSVVVIGSSHALAYSVTIDQICKEHNISVAFLSRDATPAFKTAACDDKANDFYQKRDRMISEWRPDCVIVIDRWDRYYGHLADFETQFTQFLDSVKGVTKHVIFVAQVPVLDIGADSTNPRYYVLWRSSVGNKSVSIPPNYREECRTWIAEDAGKSRELYPFLTVLRADQLFYNADGSIKYADNRVFYYLDDDHLSDAGSALLQPLFEKAILEDIPIHASLDK
jgi:peptidoglycan/LPS O-acetylase OafA/YrhL